MYTRTILKHPAIQKAPIIQDIHNVMQYLRQEGTPHDGYTLQTLAYEKLDSLQQRCNTLLSVGFGWSNQFVFLCDRFISDLLVADISIEQLFELLKTQNSERERLGTIIAAHGTPATVARFIHLLRALESHPAHAISHARLQAELLNVKKKGGLSFALQLAAGEDIAACYEVLEHHYLLPEEYHAFLPKKEALFAYINTLDRDSKIKALANAMNPAHSLGKLFWTPRGFFSVNRRTGMLRQLRATYKTLVSTREWLAFNLQDLLRSGSADNIDRMLLLDEIRTSKLSVNVIVDLLCQAKTADGWTLGMRLAYSHRSSDNLEYVIFLQSLLSAGGSAEKIAELLQHVYKKFNYGMMIASQLSPDVAQAYLALLSSLKGKIPAVTILNLLCGGDPQQKWNVGMLLGAQRQFSMHELFSEHSWNDVTLQHFLTLLHDLLDANTVQTIMRFMSSVSKNQTPFTAHIIAQGYHRTRELLLTLLSKSIDLGTPVNTVYELLKRGTFPLKIVGNDASAFIKLILKMSPTVPVNELQSLFSLQSTGHTFFGDCACYLPTSLIFELLNKGLVPKPDYIFFLDRKEEVLRHILEMKALPERYQALHNAKNPLHPLGQFFWYRRGLRTPHEARGTLSVINVALAQVEKQLAPLPPTLFEQLRQLYFVPIPAGEVPMTSAVRELPTPMLTPVREAPVPSAPRLSLPLIDIEPAVSLPPPVAQPVKKPTHQSSGLAFFAARRDEDFATANTNPLTLPKPLEPTRIHIKPKTPARPQSPLGFELMDFPPVPTAEPEKAKAVRVTVASL